MQILSALPMLTVLPHNPGFHTLIPVRPSICVILRMCRALDLHATLMVVVTFLLDTQLKDFLSSVWYNTTLEGNSNELE